VHPAVHLVQGGHECYNIAAGKIINRHHVTIAPITAANIVAVESAACADKMDKRHFKFKHGIILYHSSQIAGVYYNKDALQNKMILIMIIRTKIVNSKMKSRRTSS